MLTGVVVGGCDIGSTTGKALVMKDGEIVSFVIRPCTTKPELTARSVTDEAIKQAGLTSLDDLQYIVGTGYGRLRVGFANENVSEITCHARGAQWWRPAVRTVIDIGGQDCKAISVDEKGRVLEFAMNDKCAAGTGRFLEAMARVLHCTLEELSALSLQSQKPASITSQCSVFAESEVITLINEGVELPDIAAGIHEAIAGRLHALVRKVGLREEVVVTGGCAKNKGLVKALEKKLGVDIQKLPQDVQVAGALGAALIAMEKVEKRQGEKPESMRSEAV